MKKVLVIEDNEVIRRIFVRYLEDLGYQSPSVTCSENLIHDIIKHNPDYIFLDIHLSLISGIDVCRILKTEYSTDAIIILNSSFSSSVEKELAAKQSLCDLCISKPLTKREVDEALKQV